MALIGEVLNLLNTLIHSTSYNIVKINKYTLTNIQTCLQNALDKIEFL